MVHSPHTWNPGYVQEDVSPSIWRGCWARGQVVNPESNRCRGVGLSAKKLLVVLDIPQLPQPQGPPPSVD